MPGSSADGRHVATPVTTTLQPVWLDGSTWSTSTSTRWSQHSRASRESGLVWNQRKPSATAKFIGTMAGAVRAGPDDPGDAVRAGGLA